MLRANLEKLYIQSEELGPMQRKSVVNRGVTVPLLPGKVIWKEDCFDLANFLLPSEFLPLGTFML